VCYSQRYLISIYSLTHWHSFQSVIRSFSSPLLTMHVPSLCLALAAIASVGAHPFLPVSDAKGICQMVHKPSPNPNLRCGWPGPLDASRVAILSAPSVVADLTSCADVCHDTAGCISFGFTFNDQSCQLYSKSLLTMNIASPNSTVANSTTYYNTGCWQKQCAPVPQSCVCTEHFDGIAHSHVEPYMADH